MAEIDTLTPMQRAGVLRQIPWAISALWKEVFAFRFSYPIEEVTEARERASLRFYVFSEALFADHLSFDADGVAVKTYRAQGAQYNPVFVAWFALMSLERYAREANPEHLAKFYAQTRWLKTNAKRRTDGTTVWYCRFDWQEGRCRLKAPWISAMSQGLALSALVRAFRLTQDESLLSLAEEGARVFDRSIEQGGVRTLEHGHALYEEYPGYPLPRILDGFLFSLLGLYDLSGALPDSRARLLFDQGIDGLKCMLSNWDYRGKWTWYGNHGYLCPPHYHTLNATLIKVLGQITGDRALLAWRGRWDIKRLSFLDRSEIFLLFAFTKNLARLRLPRN